MRANGSYKVEVLDASNGTISEIRTQADENGTIGTSPIWYDVGFRKDATGKPYLETATELALHAFNIRVVSLDESGNETTTTDFKLPFFFVNTTDFARPEPIVMAGKKDAGTGKHVVDNIFKAHNASPLQTGEKLYVKVANMTDLGGATGTTARVYIVPFKGVEWAEGDIIDGNSDWFYQDCTLTELTQDSGVEILWPPTGPNSAGTRVAEIPEYAEGNSYSVVLDVGSDGIYNILKTGTTTYYLDGIDGNGVAGFVVQEPPAVAAKVININLASNGFFNYVWNPTLSRYEYSYGYVNTFNKNGSGTNYASHTQSEFWGYGVKVIWNPYGTYQGWNGGGTTNGLYWGSVVDVYIVTSDQTLNVNDPIDKLATGTTKRRVPVQSGCSNGWYQQTIWRPTMTIGNYMIIVDMDKNGKISDGDLVDQLDQGGNLRTVGGKPAGFSVY